MTIVDGKPVQPWETEPGAEKHTTFALECRHCGRRKGGFVQRRDVNLWPVLDLLVDAGRTRVTLRELAKVIGRFDDTQRRV